MRQLTVDEGELSLEFSEDEQIRLSAPEECDPGELAYLVAYAAATRWALQGGLTLHAIAVRRRDRVVVVAAPSLGGKTTILRALEQRGWTALSSNRLVIQRRSTAPSIVASTNVVTARPFHKNPERPLQLLYDGAFPISGRPEPVTLLICYAQSTRPLILNVDIDAERRLFQLAASALATPPVVSGAVSPIDVDWSAVWQTAKDLGRDLRIVDAVGTLEDLVEAVVDERC